MRFVEAFFPDFIILENVSGMRSTAGGAFEKEIKSSMESLGYKVSISLLNAADYGVPQARKRLIFVGVKDGEEYSFPQGAFIGKHRTVADAISDLPSLGNNEKKEKCDSSPLNSYQALMRGEGEIESIPQSLTLHNHQASNHPQKTIEKLEATKEGEAIYASFKQRIRLRNDAPSPTQLAGAIRPQFQFGHPTQPRGLSIRERARIQSFPDSFVFLGGITQERVQTGNAVPPLLVYNLAKSLFSRLSSI